MSEPIELYDKDANLVLMHAPLTAAIMVERGELFECPPIIATPEMQASPPAKPATRRRKATAKKE